MKLNHLHLTVTEVATTVAFLEKYFGLQHPEGDQHNANFAVLFDDDGLVLTLMKAGHNTVVQYPGHFHIGFMQASEDQVNEIYHRLKTDGFAVEPPQRYHAWTFSVQAPGGFMIEVLS